MIKIKHNLDADKFKWLWCKYVQAGNDEKHCTNSLKGKYSKKFSKHNENFNNETTIIFDEQPEDSFIYVELLARDIVQKRIIHIMFI